MGKDFTKPHPEYQKAGEPLKVSTETSTSQTVDQNANIFDDSAPEFEWVEGTHSVLVGYVLWIFGFMGAHRFYYGKPVSGTIWLCTFGLFFVGWIFDLFLIPAMDREADLRYVKGPFNHTIAFVLLTFLGAFGIHRFYLGKYFTGLIFLLTIGLLGFGLLYDFWTLN